MNPEIMTDEYLEAVEEEREHFPSLKFTLWEVPGGRELILGSEQWMELTRKTQSPFPWRQT